jgi:hypothetical protein
MLGPAKHRDLDRPTVASLERLVPADHFYRHLDAALDLSFVRSADQQPAGQSDRSRCGSGATAVTTLIRRARSGVLQESMTCSERCRFWRRVFDYSSECAQERWE